MTARPLTEFDHLMIAAAVRRARVRLVDGRTATLIAWRPRRTDPYGNEHRRRTARIEHLNGNRATVRCIDVIAIVDQPTTAEVAS